VRAAARWINQSVGAAGSWPVNPGLSSPCHAPVAGIPHAALFWSVIGRRRVGWPEQVVWLRDIVDTFRRNAESVSADIYDRKLLPIRHGRSCTGHPPGSSKSRSRFEAAWWVAETSRGHDVGAWKGLARNGKALCLFAIGCEYLVPRQDTAPSRDTGQSVHPVCEHLSAMSPDFTTSHGHDVLKGGTDCYLAAGTLSIDPVHPPRCLAGLRSGVHIEGRPGIEENPSPLHLSRGSRIKCGKAGLGGRARSGRGGLFNCNSRIASTPPTSSPGLSR